MASLQSNEAFFAALRQQIERWCDQRRLRERALLPGYKTFFGLTDDWARLYEALKETRAIGRERFSAAEWELLNDPISAAERTVYATGDRPEPKNRRTHWLAWFLSLASSLCLAAD